MGFQNDDMMGAENSDDEDLEAELSALTQGSSNKHQKKSKCLDKYILKSCLLFCVFYLWLFSILFIWLIVSVYIFFK